MQGGITDGAAQAELHCKEMDEGDRCRARHWLDDHKSAGTRAKYGRSSVLALQAPRGPAGGECRRGARRGAGPFWRRNRARCGDRIGCSRYRDGAWSRVHSRGRCQLARDPRALSAYALRDRARRPRRQDDLLPRGRRRARKRLGHAHERVVRRRYRRLYRRDGKAPWGRHRVGRL